MRLGLLVNGLFSDASELAQAALTAIENLSFRGGASGDRIIEELQKPPYGYADMQIRLAISVLCAQGKLKAIAPGGAVVAIGGGLEERCALLMTLRKRPLKKKQQSTLWNFRLLRRFCNKDLIARLLRICPLSQLRS